MNDRTIDRGGAVEQLQRLGLAKPNENQNKIHTKIWQGEDGWLHFASMDEGGENEDGSKLPTFGSHLWRIRPGTDEWEHLAEVREAVIASAIGGRFIYYLGYFDHVLYQWDTVRSELSGRVRVGSNGGHVSRNLLADSQGHVYVPRIIGARVELVEFDESLREVTATPLMNYDITPDSSSHGIVGFAKLNNDGFAFATNQGRLYRLTPRATGAAIGDLGMFHPDGASYCAALVSFDGQSSVWGVGRKPNSGESQYEWIRMDLSRRTSVTEQFRTPGLPAQAQDLLLYGNSTVGDDGRIYLVGRVVVNHVSQPVALSVHP